MKKDEQKHTQGFTLIEVLISVIIITIITLVSTNILQSSLTIRESTFQSLDEVKKFNLASSIIRRDLRQSLNVPMRSFYGEDYDATFLSIEGSNNMIFSSLVETGTLQNSLVKRIEYFHENDSFYRRQYFSDNPYMEEDYFESILFENFDELNLSFSDGNDWSDYWPKDAITSRKIPRLVRINLSSNNKSLEWIVSPNIENVYE
ncbi:MAG: type II secretion system protein GspJ [Gammaproteobacteria bacterium]|nr:type II secretion system protein GspJ [Gammaproteobacteria bacterium]